MDILFINPTNFINNLSPFGVQFIIFCATWLGILTIIWVIIYMLFRPIPYNDIFAPFEKLSRRFFNLGFIAISVFSAYILSVVCKNYYEIGRPAIFHLDLHPLMNLSGYGFPSGHAAFYSALATSVFLIHRRAGIYVGIVALVIGIARVLSGVHSPLDILGGYLLGIFVSFCVYMLSRKM
jgi:membrane-associated phospholipid phosphatase